MTDNRELIERFTQAWTKRDVAAVMALMTDDCEFYPSVGPEPGGSYFGREEVTRAYNSYIGGPADPAVTAGPTTVHIGDTFAVTQWSTRIERPGEEIVTVFGCDVFLFERGAIKSKATYRKVAGPPPC